MNIIKISHSYFDLSHTCTAVIVGLQLVLARHAFHSLPNRVCCKFRRLFYDTLLLMMINIINLRGIIFICECIYGFSVVEGRSSSHAQGKRSQSQQYRSNIETIRQISVSFKLVYLILNGTTPARMINILYSSPAFRPF